MFCLSDRDKLYIGGIPLGAVQHLWFHPRRGQAFVGCLHARAEARGWKKTERRKKIGVIIIIGLKQRTWCQEASLCTSGQGHYRTKF